MRTAIWNFLKFREENQMEMKFRVRNFRNFGFTSGGCTLFRKFREMLFCYAGNFWNSNQNVWSNWKPYKSTTFGNCKVYIISTRDLGRLCSGKLKKKWFTYLFHSKWIPWLASGPLVSSVVFGRSFHRFYCQGGRRMASCMTDISRSLNIACHIRTHHLSKFLWRDQQTWNLKVAYVILNGT